MILQPAHTLPPCAPFAGQAKHDGSWDASTIKAAVLDLWRRLDEQLHRVEASLPSGAHLGS
jgi:hypothetical protein